MTDDTGSTERRGRSLAAVVTATVVGLIWLSTSGRLPDFLAPTLSDRTLHLTPHVNAALVSLALVTLATGYRAIGGGDVDLHARAMATTAVLFFGFLGLYLLRLANEGLTEFQGPDEIYLYVYLPVLAVHMVLAAAAVPLVVYAVYVGARLPREAVQETLHPRVGRVAAPLWGVSFVLGLVVYLLLHHVY